MSADQALTVSGEGQEIDARIVVTEPFEKLARLRIPDKDAGGMNILASIVGHRDGTTATDDPLTVRGEGPGEIGAHGTIADIFQHRIEIEAACGNLARRQQK